MAKNKHVIPRGGQWAVKTEGSSAATVYKSKQEAIDVAREKARQDGSNLIIHGKNGQIIQRPIEATTLKEDAVRAAVRSLANARAKEELKAMLKDAEIHPETGRIIRINSTRAKSARTKSSTNSSNKKKADEA